MLEILHQIMTEDFSCGKWAWKATVNMPIPDTQHDTPNYVHIVEQIMALLVILVEMVYGKMSAISQ